MSVDKSFLGSGWSFPPEFGKQGVSMVSAEEDIQQSLIILLGTAPGERIMQPTFGCGLKNKVFDSLNESTAAQIKDLVQRAILFFEPRISVEKIDIREEDARDGRVLLDIRYIVRTTNSRHNMVYPFYLREGTNVRQ